MALACHGYSEFFSKKSASAGTLFRYVLCSDEKEVRYREKRHGGSAFPAKDPAHVAHHPHAQHDPVVHRHALVDDIEK